MRVLRAAGVGVASLASILLVAGVAAGLITRAKLARRYELPPSAIAMPYPPSPEAASLAAAPAPAPGADASDAGGVNEEWRALAVARGRHYLDSRAMCRDCHGEDLGGKVMVANPLLGRLVGPNITRGGVTREYSAADWVRIVRHGVLPSGRPALMPSTDYSRFSDQEISDIAEYIESLPPVAREMPPSVVGPLLGVLVATGRFPVSAERIDHLVERPRFPPATVAGLELGAHLASVCAGCHGADFSGGPIAGADPSWPPAQNITFDPSGIAGWTQGDFRKALTMGVRPDGTRLNPAMPVAYTARMQPVEIDSLYLYFQSLPKRAYAAH